MRNEPEKMECFDLVYWMTLKGLKFSHVAQETFTKSWSIKATNVKMGVRPGVPDYIIIIPANKSRSGKSKLIFLEMKSLVGHATREQRDWIAAIKETGNEAFVCRGAFEAIKVLEEFIY